MEATQVSVSNGFEDGAVFDGIGGQLIEASAGVGSIHASSSGFCTDILVASCENKRQSTIRDLYLKDSSVHPRAACDPTVQVPASTPGVSNCYVFKSRLQEYAQKVGLPTPVYETIKEGPSHEPSFRSTVIVGGARYESLPGFFNRKAAEQSAAEVALMELSKSGEKKDSITMPVHETGLCKNLLQEYAQKMNYAIPTYICRKDDTPGRTPLFSCTVEIGAIQYIGAAARTKKEAEIRAARTALLAIRSSGNVGDHDRDGRPQYTVVPCKRKMPETAPPPVETLKAKKPKKPRFKKKPPLNRIQPGDSGHQTPNAIQGSNGQASSDLDNAPLTSNLRNGDMSVEGDSGPQVGVVDSGQTQLTASSCQPEHKYASSVEPAVSLADASKNHEENHGIGNVIPVKAPLFSGELDASPTDSKIDQEHLATDKNYMGDANNVSENIPSA